MQQRFLSDKKLISRLKEQQWRMMPLTGYQSALKVNILHQYVKFVYVLMCND